MLYIVYVYTVQRFSCTRASIHEHGIFWTQGDAFIRGRKIHQRRKNYKKKKSSEENILNSLKAIFINAGLENIRVGNAYH